MEPHKLRVLWKKEGPAQQGQLAVRQLLPCSAGGSS